MASRYTRARVGGGSSAGILLWPRAGTRARVGAPGSCYGLARTPLPALGCAECPLLSWPPAHSSLIIKTPSTGYPHARCYRHNAWQGNESFRNRRKTKAAGARRRRIKGRALGTHRPPTGRTRAPGSCYGLARAPERGLGQSGSSPSRRSAVCRVPALSRPPAVSALCMEPPRNTFANTCRR